jgi:hypothetical protein
VVYTAGLATGETFAKQTPPSVQAIGPFCYPLGKRESDVPSEQSARLKYTFSLMDTKGKALHGFCRRAATPPTLLDASEQDQVCFCLASVSNSR